MSLFAMIRFCFFGMLILCSSAYAKEEYVVCVHGFFGASWNMHFFAKNFRKEGWHVVNWNYPSRMKYIEDHAEELVKEIRKLAADKAGRPIHFVAHSMGCLVLRSALNHPECPGEAKMGKVVLIAPPNQGSSWGRYLNKFVFAREIAKEFSGAQLFREKNFDYLGNFPHPKEKILVIAGNFGFNPFIEGENDGTVAVSETFLKTPHEHRIIKRGHHTLIFSKKTFILAKRFLEE